MATANSIRDLQHNPKIYYAFQWIQSKISLSKLLVEQLFRGYNSLIKKDARNSLMSPVLLRNGRSSL